MFDVSTEKPDVQESYQTAINTTDLTVEADRRGAGDVLIAAGWSESRLGQALIRLQGEWDGAGKPRKLTELEIEHYAQVEANNLARERKLPKGAVKPDVRKMRTAALIGYSQGMKRRAEQMRARVEVMELLADWALMRGVDAALLGPALTHWTTPTCPVCDGHGKRKLPEAPVLGKQCHHCNGSGERPRPLNSDRILNYLADCTAKAKRSMGRRMRNTEG
jgi:hypothetical protein